MANITELHKSAQGDGTGSADAEAIKRLARAVFETEAAAIGALAERVDDNFVAACEHMLRCEGRIVVLGMGKSGHVVLKINGATMCELDDRDPRRLKRGCLALQVHVGPPMTVQFKDIRIRPLP